MALLDQNCAADNSPGKGFDSLALLKGTDCMTQPIKTLDAGAKKDMYGYNTYCYALFIFPQEAAIKAEISSQNLVYRYPGDFMKAFVPEIQLSPFFDWRKLMSCTAEYGLLITNAALNGSMDQNWLYIVVLGTLAILLQWSLGRFACKDHTGSHLFDVCKQGKSWGFCSSCLATGKGRCSFRESHCKTIRACLFCLPIYRVSIAHVVLAGWRFCFCALEKLIQVQPSQVFSSGGDLKLCPFVPYLHPFLFCSLHPHLG